MQETSYAAHAAFLIGLADPAQACTTFYDEDDETVHEWEDGVLSISTDFADYTTYKLTPVAASVPLRFDVLVENENGVADFDDDAQADLSERLARLVGQIRQFQDKRALTDEELSRLQAMLLPAGEWEWKEWPETGTHAVQDACAVHELGLTLVAPSSKQQRDVAASDDFSDGVLAWFRRQLQPQGWTLVAVTPFDELQSFFLVANDNVETVRALLYQQGHRML
ncbi:hypothetical protein [Janthinobacterium sp. RB2R34]|uniref:hypothetical protein n=1 Tax=Janthinobacterium sp. RB2R34 TaxID=3424193 RepID=UPI003F22AD1F